MFQLVYLSKPAFEATPAALAREIDAILATSRHNNPRLGVTGALVFAETHFLQLLEGEQAAVEDLFGAIERDPRHTGVRVVFTRTVEHRMFPDWSMAHVTARDFRERLGVKDDEPLCERVLRLPMTQVIGVLLRCVLASDKAVSVPIHARN